MKTDVTSFLWNSGGGELLTNSWAVRSKNCSAPPSVITAPFSCVNCRFCCRPVFFKLPPRVTKNPLAHTSSVRRWREFWQGRVIWHGNITSLMEDSFFIFSRKRKQKTLWKLLLRNSNKKNFNAKRAESFTKTNKVFKILNRAPLCLTSAAPPTACLPLRVQPLFTHCAYSVRHRF